MMSLSIVPPTTPVNEEWRTLLRMRGKEIANCPYNVRVFLQNHPDYRGFLRWNKITLAVEVTGGALLECSDPNNIDELVTWAQDHLTYKHDLALGRDEVGRRLVTVAMENSYDPLQDYLNGLKWDGTHRVDKWLSKYAGATDDKYSAFVGRKWLLACVARAMQPGCKADVVLVAEGEQGAHKSTMLKILGGDWYSEASGALGDKDSKQLIGSAWICELPDMASFSRSDRNVMKAFFSSAVDRFRPPYAKGILTIKRRAVFGATTNDEDYLGDPTGHRRFWCVLLHDIDRAALIVDRDQLWAEAVHIYKAAQTCAACAQVKKVVPGEEGRCLEHAWWLADDEKTLAKVQAKLREENDAWENSVLKFAVTPVAKLTGDLSALPLTTANIWLHALNSQDITRIGRRETMRIATILKRAGYTRDRRGADSVWIKETSAPPPPPMPPTPPAPLSAPN